MNVPKVGNFDYNRRMIWLRKGLVYLLSIVLLVALVGGIAVLNINRDLANPRHLESRLAASGLYDRLAAAVLQQAEKSSSNNGDSGTVSLNDPAVQQAAANVFSPALIQREVNAFLDGNYNWLSGKKAVPDFNIDLTSAKETFAKQVGQAVQVHLTNLPVCSAEQLAQLPIPVDPLTVTCRPITLDAKAEGDRVAQEINSSQEFLGNPVITPGSLSQVQPNQNGSGSGQPQPQSNQPYYKKLSWAPSVYQVGLKLPWILGGLALLCALGIVTISLTRRRGWRRVGVVFLLAGIILIGFKFLADAGVNKVAGLVTKSTMLAALKQPINDLLHKLEPQLVQGYLWFGIAFVVIAVAIFIWLYRSREGAKTNADKPASATEPMTDSRPAEGGQPEQAASARLTPRRQPSAPPLSPAEPPSKPVSKPSPLGKNPPRRKPPRLIQ